MPRVKSENLAVWMQPTSSFWSTEGMKVETESEKFKTRVDADSDAVELEAKYRQVSFGGNLEIAVKAIGSVEKILELAEDSINADVQTQAKNKVKSDSLGFEKQVSASYQQAVAAFVEARGTQPTEEQRKKIRAKVRANLEAIEALKAGAANIGDDI